MTLRIQGSVRGPYCDVDLRRWWVAVEDSSYLDARRSVKGTAEVDPFWSRLVYRGRERVRLWDDERCEFGHGCGDDCPDGCDEDHDDDTCDNCRRVMAWAFEVVER